MSKKCHVPVLVPVLDPDLDPVKSHIHLLLLLLILLSLLVQAETDEGSVVAHSSGDKTGSSGMSPSAIEGMLLMAVEKLYKEDRELDVQMGLLRVVLQVLQRHGEACTSCKECDVCLAVHGSVFLFASLVNVCTGSRLDPWLLHEAFLLFVHVHEVLYS